MHKSKLVIDTLMAALLGSSLFMAISNIVSLPKSYFLIIKIVQGPKLTKVI